MFNKYVFWTLGFLLYFNAIKRCMCNVERLQVVTYGSSFSLCSPQLYQCGNSRWLKLCVPVPDRIAWVHASPLLLPALGDLLLWVQGCTQLAWLQSMFSSRWQCLLNISGMSGENQMNQQMVLFYRAYLLYLRLPLKREASCALTVLWCERAGGLGQSVHCAWVCIPLAVWGCWKST